MQAYLWNLLWRRKLYLVLISASLILLTLWIWTFIGNDANILNNDNQAFTLQKLISQANRVLRSQHQRQQQQRKFINATPVLLARRESNAKADENFLFEEQRLKILENQVRARNALLNDLNDNSNNNNNNMDLEQYERELYRMGVPVIPGIGQHMAMLQPNMPTPPAERFVHLDLKGAPPKLSFLKQMLPMLKTLGATGLLIEYEDMFPYAGALHMLAAKNAYKLAELKDFLETVALHGLSVTPLLQTFGHFEFALKLENFEHLREVPESPQALCPSRAQSMTLIEQMLTQVIEFHLNLTLVANDPLKFTHVHIGCDEVQSMGHCETCRQHSPKELFLTHVASVASFVRQRWSQLSVIIWDDMLRDISLTQLQHSQIGSYVEPMVWHYSNDIYHFVRPIVWDRYAKVFPTAWVASAFKGAFGESLMLPPLLLHLENNLRWLATIAKEGGRFSRGIQGIALTGWQRYDHFAVLCELLPVAMPSLITSLSTVSKGYFDVNPKENSILRVLECAFQPDMRRSEHPWIELQADAHHSHNLFNSCSYLGSLAYKFMCRLMEKLAQARKYLEHVQLKMSALSAYNVRHNFSAPASVHYLVADASTFIADLSTMSRESHEVLYDIYDEHTIAEFVEQQIYSVVVDLRQQLDNAHHLLQRRTWTQRPLPPPAELFALNLLPEKAFEATSSRH